MAPVTPAASDILEDGEFLVDSGCEINAGAGSSGTIGLPASEQGAIHPNDSDLFIVAASDPLVAAHNPQPAPSSEPERVSSAQLKGNYDLIEADGDFDDADDDDAFAAAAQAWSGAAVRPPASAYPAAPWLPPHRGLPPAAPARVACQYADFGGANPHPPFQSSGKGSRGVEKKRRGGLSGSGSSGRQANGCKKRPSQHPAKQQAFSDTCEVQGPAEAASLSAGAPKVLPSPEDPRQRKERKTHARGTSGGQLASLLADAGGMDDGGEDGEDDDEEEEKEEKDEEAEQGGEQGSEPGEPDSKAVPRTGQIYMAAPSQPQSSPKGGPAGGPASANGSGGPCAGKRGRQPLSRGGNQAPRHPSGRGRRRMEVGPSLQRAPPPCRYLKQLGFCRNGDACEFAHSGFEPETKATPCRFAISGACLRGADCPFSHDLRRFPCKFFHLHAGGCLDGERCRFSHAAVPVGGEQAERLQRVWEEGRAAGRGTAGRVDVGKTEMGRADGGRVDARRVDGRRVDFGRADGGRVDAAMGSGASGVLASGVGRLAGGGMAETEGGGCGSAPLPGHGTTGGEVLPDGRLPPAPPIEASTGEFGDGLEAATVGRGDALTGIGETEGGFDGGSGAGEGVEGAGVASWPRQQKPLDDFLERAACFFAD